MPYFVSNIFQLSTVGGVFIWLRHNLFQIFFGYQRLVGYFSSYVIICFKYLSVVNGKRKEKTVHKFVIVSMQDKANIGR